MRTEINLVEKVALVAARGTDQQRLRVQAEVTRARWDMEESITHAFADVRPMPRNPNWVPSYIKQDAEIGSRGLIGGKTGIDTNI